MAGLPQPERYHLVAPLPPVGGWRRMLALDRRAGAAGPVVLSFPPAALVEDPTRLAALARDAEAGARLHHRNAVPLLGLETVDDQVALVEPYRAGITLRALLDASGRLPVDLAVRIVCDAAAGLGDLHAVDPGDGQPLAHGAFAADRVLVAEDGASLVTGIGAGGGRSVAEDVRALGAVLHEAISGEPAESPARPLSAAGVPASLAAVVDRALGAAIGESFLSAREFAEAAAQAYPPAAVEAVAVYAEAAAPPSLPSPEVAAASPSPAADPPSTPAVAPPSTPSAAPPLPPQPDSVPEVSAELLAPGAGVEERSPPPDAAITFPVPPPVPARFPRGRALALALLAAVGFCIGYGLSRVRVSGVAPAPTPAQVAPAAGAAGAPTTEAASGAAPAPATPPASASAASVGSAPAPALAPKPEPPSRKPTLPSLSVTSVPPAEVLVDGKPAGRSPVLVEVAAGEHEVRLRDRGLGVDVRRKVSVRAAATPVRFQLVRGTLEVTAPADTEVWVDGRRVGDGDQKVELWEGWHEVEVRRAGARAHERFELTSEVTRWTYAVTPTP